MAPSLAVWFHPRKRRPATPAEQRRGKFGGNVDPKKLEGLLAQLDAIRAQADKVRAKIDSVAAIITSIPFVGAVAGAYVREIVLLVDALDTAIDALDDGLHLIPLK